MTDTLRGSRPATNAVSGSVSISPGQGLRIALRLFWDSLISLVLRRSGVTFYFWGDR